jgi:predicted ribosome quality control (RQC) complex YloA/Tae2 family protein
MQHNYYFLRQLTPALQQELKGLELVSCFSQNKDELLIGFANQEKGFYIKALLTPILCCLSFPETVHRTRRNSADLFLTLIGGIVKEVKQVENERCFFIEFENSNKKLLFKMQGQRANIVAIEDDKVSEVFKSELEKDWDLHIQTLHRPIDQTEKGFLANGLQKTFPTFDKTILEYLEKITKKPAQEASFAEVQAVMAILENPTFYITEIDKQLKFTLFAPEKILFASKNPLLALQQFYQVFTHSYYFETEKNTNLKKLESRIKQTQQYLKKVEEKFTELLEEVSYEKIANIIMANLHSLPKETARNQTNVELFDFYSNKNIVIKLKENLSPQKTAETYYRKSKNQKIEIDRIEQNIAQKQELLQQLMQYHTEITNITDFKILRNYLKTNNLETKLASKEDENQLHLFKKFVHENFEIWIGKNAQNNDLLTQRHSYKEDLWLHARDVTGSHVLIKYQAGKKFPMSVIERAAQLAAYFSKRKNDTLCPVIYTPKKYVRKPKGAAAGSVKIEREEVIMVCPSLL